MSTLEACKERIDGGEVAELELRRPIRIDTNFYDGTVITIHRDANKDYVWSLYRLVMGNIGIHMRREPCGPDWAAFLLRIEGVQTEASDWTTRPMKPTEKNEISTTPKNSP